MTKIFQREKQKEDKVPWSARRVAQPTEEAFLSGESEKDPLDFLFPFFSFFFFSHSKDEISMTEDFGIWDF